MPNTMKIRPYKCTICGNKDNITTNHEMSCLHICKSCSWKGIGFGEGFYLFGSLHRTFVFDGISETLTPLGSDPEETFIKKEIK